MSRPRPFTLVCLAALCVTAAACTSSPSGSPKAGRAGSASASTTPTPTQDEAKRKQAEALINAVGGGKRPQSLDEDETPGEGDIVVDEKTGKRLQRLPKTPPYYVSQGRVHNAILNDPEGFPLVKEDESYFYILAAPERPAADVALERAKDAVQQSPIVDIPAEEAEVVTPKTSRELLRFEEMSEGLPKIGMWRENFAMADLDGDGRPEIVSPPPRLSGGGLRIFKLEGKRWKAITPQIEESEHRGFDYGGVAVADMDGDGRPDIVYGGHGRSPMILHNEGGFRFRVETRGITRGLSTRDMALGDLDGDGRQDILAISDDPEYARTSGEPKQIGKGYVQGYDVRAYLNRGSEFKELVSGLHRACYGYSIALSIPKEGDPFFVSSCRYFGGVFVLYTFDRKKLTFEHAALDVVETYAGHLGSAVGTYRGHPAAFVSYIKNGPTGASRKISGSGVTIYYREGDQWKRKRVVKVVGDRASSSGIAVGDLNGDGLDDIVYADELERRVRVLLQTPSGEFEEIDRAAEPTFVNHPTCVRLADVDGDGRLDIIMMYQYLTGDAVKSGGFRVFRSVP